MARQRLYFRLGKLPHGLVQQLLFFTQFEMQWRSPCGTLILKNMRVYSVRPPDQKDAMPETASRPCSTGSP
jgi:hypothetical protein